MTTHGRREEAAEQSTIKILREQMERMTVDFDKVCRENSELRAQLLRLSGDSARRKDFDFLNKERERHAKLCDQLKNEKSHLIETILELSNEIDALHVENSNDQQQLSQRIRNFIEIDKQAISSRSQMEVQIIDAIAASGSNKDCALMKKIEAIIKASRVKSSPVPSQIDFIPSPHESNQKSNNIREEFDDVRYPEHLDAASLRAIDDKRASGDAFGFRSETSPSTDPQSRTRTGPGSIRSCESRRRLFPGKKRGKQAMERDETESVISSVSTHRSVRSLGSLSLSWFRNPNGEKVEKIVKSKKKSGGAITAENLAILNGLNDDTGHDTSRERPADRAMRQQKTPGDRDIDRGKDSFWWPSLF